MGMDNAPTIQPDNPEAIVKSIVEQNWDSKKSRYIGYRASGFTIREAASLIKVGQRTVVRWRQEDSVFASMEEQLPELRKRLGLEYANMEFLRNYRLLLEKDYNIIMKSMELKGEEALPVQDHQYLLKARGHYTPQQLECLKGMIGDEAGRPLDFTKFILSISRTREEVRIETSKEQEKDSIIPTEHQQSPRE